MFKLLRWTAEAMNVHFRILYSAGIWVYGAQARQAIHTGFCMLELSLHQQSLLGTVNVAWAVWVLSTVWVMSTTKEGFGMLAAEATRTHGWALFRVQPKLHMALHIVMLAVEETNVI